MLFNFELLPIEEIGPWTNAKGDEKSLHWFALTFGYYWIDTGAGELFRSSPEILQHWAQEYPEIADQPYLDYQVARLWEDVLDMLPTVLEPVPDNLTEYIQPGGLWGTEAAWKDWIDRAFAWERRNEIDSAGDEFEFAFRWWSDRSLSAGHLTTKPVIDFWREGDDLYIRWDNRDLTVDGIPVWDSASGQVTMPVEAFVAEVRSFDKRLMEAMVERIESIQQHWSRPEIRIDIPDLIRNQEYRTTLLAAALAPAREPTDWDRVRASLTAMEQHLAEVRNSTSETDTE